jgi:hypothetical protein
MASFIQVLIGTILVLTFTSSVSVNSLPTNETNEITNAADIISVIETVVANKDPTCFIETDCHGHGKCHSDRSGCDCERGWASPDNGTDTNKYCTYQQKTKKTAFFVSLFTGYFGADWFYLSRGRFSYIIAGILKLLLGFGFFGAWALTYSDLEIENLEILKSKLRRISTCLCLAAFTWWIVDWARVLGNKFPDGNGHVLMSW